MESKLQRMLKGTAHVRGSKETRLLPLNETGALHELARAAHRQRNTPAGCMFTYLPFYLIIVLSTRGKNDRNFLAEERAATLRSPAERHSLRNKENNKEKILLLRGLSYRNPKG